MNRRRFIHCSAGAAAWLTSSNFASADRRSERTVLPRLAEAYREAFPVGVALSSPVPDKYTAQELALVKQHFRIVTPGNCLKWKFLQTGLDEWDFEKADAFVKWVGEQKLKAVGHCLIWNREKYDPVWLFEGDKGPASKQLVLDRLQQSIEKIVGRYAGKLDSWEVVNEAIGDTRDGPMLRESRWTRFTGDAFIETAYRAVMRAAPKARLAYNDYNTEYDWRRERIIKLVRGLQDKGIPIGIIGIQGHYELDDIPFEKIEQTIVELHQATGARIAVTELDIDVVRRKDWWGATSEQRIEISTRNPYPGGCPAEIIERQAEQYEKLFRIFLNHRDKLDRVTFWGLSDKRSWLNTWPWNRANYPLLFDAALKPKPAFDRLLKLAGNGTGGPGR